MIRRTKDLRTFNARKVQQMKARRRETLMWMMYGDWAMVCMMSPDTRRLAAGAVSCNPKTQPYEMFSVEELQAVSLREVEEFNENLQRVR